MKKKSLFISLFITLLFVISFMIIYKVVPFGNMLLGSEDYSIYYVLWNYVHSVKIFNIYDTFSFLTVNNLLSLPNFIICIFSKKMIPSVINIIFIVKMLLINGTMYYSLSRIFKDKKEFYKILFSLLYTFSGFVFIEYYSITSLDMLYLFPLLMYGYYKLVKENKIILFNIIFILCGIVNYKMFIVVLLYLVGLILFSFVILDFKNKKEKLIKLCISTLLCIGILSIFNYINIDYLISSSELYEGYNKYVDNIYLSFRKLCYLFPCVIVIVYFIRGLFNKKFNFRNRLFLGIILLYLVLCMFIDPVNRLWHVNNYYSSLGYISFILTYVLCIGAMYGIKNENKINIISLIVSIIFIIGFVVVWFFYMKNVNLLNIDNYIDMIKYLIVISIFILGIVLISKYNNVVFKVLLSIGAILFIVINSFMYIRINMDNSLLNISSELELENDNYRYSDYTGVLDNNFGIINNVWSVQGNSNVNNSNKLLMDDSLGYLVYGNESTSCCGNVLVNSLLNNKYYFVSGEMNEKLYDFVWEKKIDKKGNKSVIRLYKSKYNLNSVIPYNGNNFDLDYGNALVNTNELFNTLFDKKDFIKEVTFDKKKNKLESNKQYYLLFNNYSEITDFVVQNDFKVEYIYEKNKVIYASMYLLEDKVVDMNSYSFKLYSINIDEFINFINELNDGIEINNDKIRYDAKEDTSLLIPIDYSKNLVIKVNGNEVKYRNNVFNMVSIDVNKGDNVIEISYSNKNVIKYVIVSIISLLLYIGFILIIKRVM